MILTLILTLQFSMPSDEKISSLQTKLKNHEAYAEQRLIKWNLHEPYPYLGIGHFIWFPKGQNFPVVEDFPKLLKFFDKEGVDLPLWLKNSFSCPWSSRSEFEEDKTKSLQLRSLLESTYHLQVKYLVSHSFETFEKIVASCEDQNLMHKKILKLLQDPRGLFALVDYCHFKGSGLNEKEFKNGKGFGLKQVLESLSLDECSLEFFVKTAKDILKERVQHSDGHDTKWLSGWIKRLDHYRMI